MLPDVGCFLVLLNVTLCLNVESEVGLSSTLGSDTDSSMAAADYRLLVKFLIVRWHSTIQ